MGLDQRAAAANHVESETPGGHDSVVRASLSLLHSAAAQLYTLPLDSHTHYFL